MHYQRINNLLGWLVFFAATTVYIMTLEPTASYWDCGEFIAVSYKLEVPHPPGAPLYLLIGRMFSFLAGTEADVAYWINMASAVSSGLTIMFLFWTITILGRKLLKVNAGTIDTTQQLMVFGAGLIGSLAYTFSDTFWFSAVEAEVYAMSSFFMALVFWVILKWSQIENEANANRWLIILAYLIGLSIGVHLLNLVTIPALAFLYFFKKDLHKKHMVIKATNFNPASYFIGLGVAYILFAIGSGSGNLVDGLIGALWLPVIGGIYGAVLAIASTTSRQELKLSNNPFINFGIVTVISVILIFLVQDGIIIGLPSMAASYEIFFVNTFGLPIGSGLILFTVLFIGGLVAGIAMTQMTQKVVLNTILLCTTFILIGYASYAIVLIRSNYDTPIDENNPENFLSFISYLRREQYGDMPSLIYGQHFNADYKTQNGRIVYKEGRPIYAKKGDRYEIIDTKASPEYKDSDKLLFPRAWNTQDKYRERYMAWMNLDEKDLKRGKPGFGDNLFFFFRYQIGHMYLRYFMWNFVGRDGHLQDSGVLTPFDALEDVPDSVAKLESRNNLLALPLLLGLIGLVFQLYRDPKNFGAVTFLFVLTGVALVVYLNSPAFEPRERDYIYVGSFYAFAIWIGFGVMAIAEGLRKVAPGPVAAGIAIALSSSVPTIMAAEEWDDHDRSERYFSTDSARNLLNSCAENAILFTGGDNDTFPLWYLQEVEGVRTDVRVIVQSYFNTGWYVDQMTRQAYKSEALPFTLNPDVYEEGGPHQVMQYMEMGNASKQPSIPASTFLKLINQREPGLYLPASSGGTIAVFPNKNFRIPADSAHLANLGIVPDNLKRFQVDNFILSLKDGKNFMPLGDLMTLDLIASANWERPVYFNFTSLNGSSFDLDNHVVQEGNAYRLMPIDVPARGQFKPVNTEVMWDNMMNKFQFRNLQKEGVFYGTEYRNFIRNTRSSFFALAQALANQGDEERARQALLYCFEQMPHESFPLDIFGVSSLALLADLGEKERAEELAIQAADYSADWLEYYQKNPHMDDFEIRQLGYVLRQSIDLFKRTGNVEKANEYINRFNAVAGE